jgi:hypothetical protein
VPELNPPQFCDGHFLEPLVACDHLWPAVKAGEFGSQLERNSPKVGRVNDCGGEISMESLAQAAFECAGKISGWHPYVRYHAVERTAPVQRAGDRVMLARAQLAADPFRR